MSELTASARAARFAGPKNKENRYEALKGGREAERKAAIAQGLIPDPNKRMRLDEAFDLVGTCTDMCPEFEREQREYQRAVDKWEINPVTNRIDAALAVKTFHRPAAGDEQPLPSDVRPPPVLQSTLNYLVHDLLPRHSLEATHNFIRDRTRSIRQDFTLQHERGALAIECHERIARLHILSLHEMRGVKEYTEHLEMEQVRKVLQSLMEFYDDADASMQPPNEAEFRAYHLLAHIRDPDVARSLERQSPQILDNPLVQLALDIRSVAQRNNAAQGRRVANIEAAQNLFTRFFALVARPATPFLVACLLEFHFEDIRKGALKALRSVFRNKHKAFPIADLTRMLAFDDDHQAAAFVEGCKLVVIPDSQSGLPFSVIINNTVSFEESTKLTPIKSMRLVHSKRAHYTDSDFIDGHVPLTSLTPIVPPSPIASRPMATIWAPHSSFQIMPSVPKVPANGTTFASPPALPRSPGFSSTFTKPASISSFPTQFTSPPVTWSHPEPQLNTVVQPPSSFSNFSGFGLAPSGQQTKPFVWNTPSLPTSTPHPSHPSTTDGVTPAQFTSPGPSQASAHNIFASSFPSVKPVFSPPNIDHPSISHAPPADPSATLQQAQPPTSPPLHIQEHQESYDQLLSNPLAPPPLLEHERLELESQPDRYSSTPPQTSPLAVISDSKRYKELVETTYSMMIASWTVSIYQTELADTMHRRSVVRRAIFRWASKCKDRIDERGAALQERDRLRVMVKDARWADGKDEGPSSAPSRGSHTASPSFSRGAQPVVDEQYVESLEQAAAKRATLWAAGSFLAAVKHRITELSRRPPPHWSIWLVTASHLESHATTQWLKRKLAMDTSMVRMMQGGGAVVSRGLNGQDDLDNPGSPGFIVFEVSRTVGEAEASQVSLAWQAEAERLHRLLQTLPVQRRYDPVLALCVWIPPDVNPVDFSRGMELRAQQYLEQDPRASSLIKELLIIPLTTSASAAEQVWQDTVLAAKFDVTERQTIVVKPSVEEVIEPFLLAWKQTLKTGMEAVRLNGAISRIPFLVLFDNMVQALNRMGDLVWETLFGSLAEFFSPPFRIPPYDFIHLEVDSPSAIYELLAGFFRLPAFASNPATQVFLAELRDHALYHEDDLLSSFLPRIADIVVFEMTIAAEEVERELDGALSLPVPGPLPLERFREEVQSVLARVSNPQALLLRNGNGQKKRSREPSIHEQNGVNPKRSKPSPPPLSPPSFIQDTVKEKIVRHKVSAAELLARVKQARTRHSLEGSRAGTSVSGNESDSTANGMEW